MAAGKKTRVEKTQAGPLSPPEYRAIPIQFSPERAASHFLYVKEHRVRPGTGSAWPPGRTLFVLNVPPYCPEERLAQLFSDCCGPVQTVKLHPKPDLSQPPPEPLTATASELFCPKPVPGFQVAYLVFKKPASMQKAMALPGPLIISTESHPVKTGIEKWIADYTASLGDPEALRVEVDKFMEEYDKKVAQEDARAEAEEGVPDEEGWVKVTRKGRRPGLPRSEAANLRVLEKEKRKKARKELLNFYAWQHRETKMEHLAQLRKKFEEDKQRIALMRAQRKFRPY
ncbi:ribosomal RNA-processing protein 7 homolog A [Gracilinanus agilis]|uniref:ribosomal RNA-processing protein 7 homolog A n=1 Tax=Gracilinanus agilis TaxID=191870 RepID=UPI001CFF1938|nr:ribosomal RNA-processing protein 7 homolog A [Gracilinanus agilis]